MFKFGHLRHGFESGMNIGNLLLSPDGLVFFKFGFVGVFDICFMYFSLPGERKVPKEAPFKRKPTVSLENPFP